MSNRLLTPDEMKLDVIAAAEQAAAEYHLDPIQTDAVVTAALEWIGLAEDDTVA